MPDDRIDQCQGQEGPPSLPTLLGQASTILSVVRAEDDGGDRRTCLSIGDADSGALLLAALTNRFDRIVDVTSFPSEDSPWLQVELLRSLAPHVEIHSVAGDIFDDRTLKAALLRNGGERFEFCFLEKTLHHLRLNRCKFAGTRDHRCGGDDCVGVFDPKVVFSRLFAFARTAIVSEHHYIGPDEDKDTARGGMLSTGEIEETFTFLSAGARVRVFSPTELQLPTIRSHRQYTSVLGQHIERSEYFLTAITQARAEHSPAAPRSRRASTIGRART